MDQNEFELEHAKSMAWERDTVNRLYYGLWIVFLGGFVLSLHVAVYKYFRVAAVLVVAFRFLAIAGTAVNFWMQYHAVAGLSSARQGLFYRAFNHTKLAEAASKKAESFDRIVGRCEKPLQIIAALFLLIAFAGSFLVHLP